MSAGLRIFLADGTTVQIDETYQNLAMREKGAAVTTASVGPSGASAVNFTRVGMTNPVIAVAGSVAGCATAFDNGGGSFTFTILVAGVVGTSITFYIFDVPATTDPHFGLRVFNASGAVTYNAIDKYLRVRDIPAQTNGATLTYDSGHTYAVACNAVGYSISNIAGNVQQAVSKTVSNVVTIQMAIVDSWPGSPTFINSQLGRFIVIDVTAY